MNETIVLFLIFTSLFFYEDYKDKRKFAEIIKKDNEKILKDIEIFLESKKDKL